MNILKFIGAFLLIGFLSGEAIAQPAGQLQAGQTWGNPTGSQAYASPTTVGALLDQEYTCTAQGSIIYRSGSFWTCLGPGTSGLPLVSQGASANLHYAQLPNSALLNPSLTIGTTNIALGATSTVLNGVNIGPSTPGTGAFTTATATTSIGTPELYGGTTSSSGLLLVSTAGSGITDYINFLTGSQVIRGTISSGGQWAIGPNAPTTGTIPLFDINPTSSSTTYAGSVVPLVRLLNTVNPAIFAMQDYGSSTQFAAYVAGGTSASPTAVGSSTVIFNNQGFTWDGTQWGNGGGANASIMFETLNAQTTSDHSTQVIFNTTPSGSTTRTTAAILQSGLQVGAAPTGGDKGAGSINISGAYYANGVAVSGTGTVTSVGLTAGSGISIGGSSSPITGSGSYSVTNTGVTALNSLIGGLSITAGTGISVTPSTPNIAIAANGVLISRIAYSSTQTITIPAGATKANVVYLWGGSGGSGGGNSSLSGSGGGAGALSKYLTGLTPGNTLALTVGAAGNAGSSSGNGGAGGTTTLASGSQTITTLTANGGGGGTSGGTAGAGGTATNGDLNITGQTGTNNSLGGTSAFGLSFGGVSAIPSGAGNAGVIGGCIIEWLS